MKPEHQAIEEDAFKNFAKARGQGNGAKSISARLRYGHYNAGCPGPWSVASMKAQVKELKERVARDLLEKP